MDNAAIAEMIGTLKALTDPGTYTWDALTDIETYIRELRRYSMCGRIAIGTGFAPPEARWLEDEVWTDAQYAEAQAMIDAHPEWLEGPDTYVDNAERLDFSEEQ